MGEGISGRVFPPRNGDDAGPRYLDQADFAHQFDELVDLLGPAGHFEHEARYGRVDHAGAVDLGQPQRFDPRFAGAAHLDQRQFALDMRALGGEVVDLLAADALLDQAVAGDRALGDDDRYTGGRSALGGHYSARRPGPG